MKFVLDKDYFNELFITVNRVLKYAKMYFVKHVFLNKIMTLWRNDINLLSRTFTVENRRLLTWQNSRVFK